MRPASEVELRRLNATFAELCAIPSPFGHERAVADRVAEELRSLGLEVEEDDAGGQIGGEAGNLLARLPGRNGERSVLLCAHLDTVPHDGVVEPVLVDGAWESAGDTILGADNKATVAILLALAHRAAVEGTPVGVELLFTVGEENGLQGAKAFDVGKLRSELGFVYDHASPVGEIVVASPTFYRLQATFRGQAAHAGIRPEDGRSAIVAAAKAIGTMRLGRLDDETTANVGNIHGGADGTNVVPELCTINAEARSLSAPTVVAAEAALRLCGFKPRRVNTGGASDANAFVAAGLLCTNLANGTQHNHERTERVSQASLQGMLDVTFALLDELSGEGS